MVRRCVLNDFRVGYAKNRRTPPPKTWRGRRVSHTFQRPKSVDRINTLCHEKKNDDYFFIPYNPPGRRIVPLYPSLSLGGALLTLAMITTVVATPDASIANSPFSDDLPQDALYSSRAEECNRILRSVQCRPVSLLEEDFFWVKTLNREEQPQQDGPSGLCSMEVKMGRTEIDLYHDMGDQLEVPGLLRGLKGTLEEHFLPLTNQENIALLRFYYDGYKKYSALKLGCYFNGEENNCNYVKKWSEFWGYFSFNIRDIGLSVGADIIYRIGTCYRLANSRYVGSGIISRHLYDYGNTTFSAILPNHVVEFATVSRNVIDPGGIGYDDCLRRHPEIAFNSPCIEENKISLTVKNLQSITIMTCNQGSCDSSEITSFSLQPSCQTPAYSWFPGEVTFFWNGESLGTKRGSTVMDDPGRQIIRVSDDADPVRCCSRQTSGAYLIFRSVTHVSFNLTAEVKNNSNIDPSCHNAKRWYFEPSCNDYLMPGVGLSLVTFVGLSGCCYCCCFTRIRRRRSRQATVAPAPPNNDANSQDPYPV